MADTGAVWKTAQGAVFLLVVGFLVYGNLVYQAARLGYLSRWGAHRPATRAELDAIYRGVPRPLTALIPSYREEPKVVRQTLLSAALQEYPDKRVVLLIDDPPDPTDDESRYLLQAARSLPQEIERLLAVPAARASQALAAFEGRMAEQPPAGAVGEWSRTEARRLARELELAADWLDQLADQEESEDHTDALFIEQVLRQAAREHRREARDVTRSAGSDHRALWLGYRRLLARFEVTVTSFERKAYVNLSHEPNKAMNLNSYLSLLGRAWRRVRRPDGWHLVAAHSDHADLTVGDASYIMTLDADSVLVPSYTSRLVQLLEQPGNERMAVVQTPYSAVPDAPGVLERTAGATTDLQYIVHQGFTRHGATFWVGANALIRRSALDDIVTSTVERGFPVRRYIQDRTVIEDTESSIDLIAAGWELHNYPERLSFSATPPDFGSLVIQRRRWANGGLIILPKLLAHLARRDSDSAGSGGWMRFHYLTSITGANLGLLLVLSYAFPTPRAAMWIPVTAVPYFLLYSRDLRQAGYRYRDIFNVYGLNLLLIPVNLAGVAKSVQQGITRSKIPFGRTPKVQGRTRTPPLYLVAPLAMAVYWSAGGAADLAGGRWGHAAFEVVNVIMLSYAIVRFIGLRNFLSDLTRRSPIPADAPPTDTRPEELALTTAGIP